MEKRKTLLNVRAKGFLDNLFLILFKYYCLKFWRFKYHTNYTKPFGSNSLNMWRPEKVLINHNVYKLQFDQPCQFFSLSMFVIIKPETTY